MLAGNNDFYRTHIHLTFLLAVISLFLLKDCNKPDDSLHQAISEHLSLYPESTLQDLYKSFFQDEYGPGHLLIDTAGARNYFESELSEMTGRGNHRIEPCGTGRKFYRVPLDLIKDSIVSKEVFFQAFAESGKSFKIPDIEEWKSKWALILSEIEAMNLELDNFMSDKESISEMLERGEFVAHHSQSFLQCYDPHYRIMSKDQAQFILKN